MNERVRAHEAVLSDLSKCKRVIAISPEELRQIDQLLVQRWGIDFVQTRLNLEGYLRALPESDARTLGLTAFSPEKTSRMGKSGEQFMYEAMANLNLCGFVTSSRRHYLIDSISLSCGLYRALRLSGPVLDVGCHVGVVPDIMAQVLEVPVVGLEPVTAAVNAGSTVIKDRSNVQIIPGAIPWGTESRFEMITAIDCMPANAGDRGIFLNGLGTLLNPGGIAVVVSINWIHAEVSLLRRQLKLAGLGFGLADVVGGFGGMPTTFNVEGTVCLIKGGNRPFPRRVQAEMESEWDWFKSYANTSSTPIREKTQAFLRASLRPASLVPSS